MNTRLLGLLRKESIQFLRDRVVLVLVLYLYTMEIVMCTIAVRFEVQQLPIGVIDQDNSVASRDLTQLFTLSDAFHLKYITASPDKISGPLDRGEVGMVLVIPPGFARDDAAGLAPRVQLLLDGTYSDVAESAAHYAEQILNNYERQHPSRHIHSAATAQPVARVWYNSNQSTRTFNVLSMIALAGMMVGMMIPAAAIMREKERGTIEQLLVTPISVGEMFLAKTLPTIAINVLAIFPALVVVALFHVPLRGSLLTLILMAAAFQLSAVSFGVFVAAVTRTLQQALLLGFFALFPIMFLSGTITPIESMPKAMQFLSQASPLRYYIEIIDGVFLKGAGWTELWPQAVAVLLIGALLFSVSSVVFRRRLV